LEFVDPEEKRYPRLLGAMRRFSQGVISVASNHLHSATAM
jgi:hypothetical protein